MPGIGGLDEELFDTTSPDASDLILVSVGGVLKALPLGYLNIDVESGTWTPIVTGSQRVSAHIYATQLGQFVRVGRIVFLWFDIDISALDSSATGAARIRGLPYQETAAGNLAFPYGTGTPSRYNVGAIGGQVGFRMTNAEEFRIIESRDNATELSAQMADYSSGTRITGFCVYLTNVHSRIDQ